MMSQKVIKKTTSKANTKPNATQKSTVSQTQISRKSDENLNQKQNLNKNVKTSVNIISKNSGKPITSSTVSEVKKSNANKATVKTVVNRSTPNSSNKTTIKNKTVVKQNIKPIANNTKLTNNQIVGKEKNVLTEKQKTRTVVTQNNIEIKKVETQNLIKKESIKTSSEDLTNKVPSEEQNILLETLETNPSYKSLHGRSSESILAEPPSICELELDEIINDITDDYGSDYYDDFEDYESDFEDDDEEEEEEEESENVLVEAKAIDNNLTNSLYESNDHSNYQKPKNENNVNSNTLETEFKAQVLSRQTENKIESTFLSIDDIKSAQLKSESKVYINKSTKRGNELLEIIKLNEIGFTNCDLPPINYETFIRTFGRRDAKQVSCQTCERQDIEIQTESLVVKNKWTQNPSFARIHAGNDDEVKEIICHEPNTDPFKLINFLTIAETITTAVIECEFKDQQNKTSLPSGAEQFSSSYSILKCLGLAKKCPISYTFTNSLYLFCVQNVTKIMGSTEKSVIVVWNLLSQKQPEKVLICRSHIVCAYSEQNIVMGAMIDGSVAIWDLKEESHYNKEIIIENNKFILRSPSYSSAGTGKVHNSCIVGITQISYLDFNDNSLHFATIDEIGILMIWAINQIKGENNDSNDLGVSPTSNCKLTRISVIETLKEFKFETRLRITSFECQPNDWSQFYCGTDNGLVIRCTRHTELVNHLPKCYTNSEINSIWTRVTKISFNKTDTSSFLVGYNDGIISKYCITNEKPLIIFDANHSPIIQLKWFSNTSTFIALNNSNEIFIWNLINEDIKPFVYYRDHNNRLLSLSLWKGIKTLLVFGCDSGNALVFNLNLA